MSLASRGQSMANRLGQVAAGVAVVYERSGVFTLAITVQPGQEQVTAETFGTSLKPRTADAERDYLILAADLVAGGTSVLPRKGDRIVEVLNGVSAVFEITPREDEPAWRWSDRQRTKVRVHCKRVA